MAEKCELQFDYQLLEHINVGRVDEAKTMLNEYLAKEPIEWKNILLHYAVFENSDEIVRYLIQFGAEVDCPARGGNTPLMLAVQRAHAKVVDTLLKANVDINVVNSDGVTALQMVSAKEYVNISIIELFFERLIKGTVDTEEFVDKLMAAGCSMHCAVYLKNHHVIRRMLHRGLDVNSRNHKGRTALHLVCRDDKPDLVNMLIECGADVNAIDANGMSPLLNAALNVNKDSMRLLLEAGADPNYKSTELESTAVNIILNKVGQSNKVDQCLELLFQHGAIPEIPPQGFSSLLGFARLDETSKKLKMLINYLVMLKELGKPIADSAFHCHRKDLRPVISELVNSCKTFLSSLVLGNLTMLDLLTDSEGNMRTHVRNNNLVSELYWLISDNENKNLFPYYYTTMFKRILKAMHVVELEDSAIQILCQLLNCSYNQCYNFARKIVGYLSEKDLEQLCRV